MLSIIAFVLGIFNWWWFSRPKPLLKEPPTVEFEKDIYPSLVDLAIHGQDNKLNLFSGFLFFQSILLLAWATVWQVKGDGKCWILAALSLFGTLSSFAWAFLERDYANASESVSKAAVWYENQHFPEGYRALADRQKILEKKKPWERGKFLIGFVTFGFAVLYPVLELFLR